MSLPFDTAKLETLRGFLSLCKQNHSWLHSPELAFLKSFIEDFGGVVPPAKGEKNADSEPQKGKKTKTDEHDPEPELESEESDIELDMTGVLGKARNHGIFFLFLILSSNDSIVSEPDTEPPQRMGNPTLQPTEDEISESQAKRSEAVSAVVEKNYERAIALYTESIILNPQAALLYAKRGQIYLLMEKPNACIRDCDRALELNPDSAAAHKFRGRAYQLLGNFEEAAADLRLACKFDFDEQADEWLREVTPNVSKLLRFFTLW